MVHLAGSTPQTEPAPVEQGCIAETVFADCPGANGQHMAEFVAIAEVDAEVDSEVGVEVGAEVEAGVEAGAAAAAGAGVEVGAEVAREAAG
jgi:hypothetical protein